MPTAATNLRCISLGCRSSFDKLIHSLANIRLIKWGTKSASLVRTFLGWMWSLNANSKHGRKFGSCFAIQALNVTIVTFSSSFRGICHHIFMRASATDIQFKSLASEPEIFRWERSKKCVSFKRVKFSWLSRPFSVFWTATYHFSGIITVALPWFGLVALNLDESTLQSWEAIGFLSNDLCWKWVIMQRYSLAWRQKNGVGTTKTSHNQLQICVERSSSYNAINPQQRTWSKSALSVLISWREFDAVSFCLNEWPQEIVVCAFSNALLRSPSVSLKNCCSLWGGFDMIVNHQSFNWCPDAFAFSPSFLLGRASRAESPTTNPRLRFFNLTSMTLKAKMIRAVVYELPIFEPKFGVIYFKEWKCRVSHDNQESRA